MAPDTTSNRSFEGRRMRPGWRGLERGFVPPAFVLSALLVTGGCAEEEAESAEQLPTAQVEAEIQEADQAEVRAILHGDRELQGRIWGDEFVVTNADGQVLTKTQVMAVFEQGAQPYQSFERETESVRVYGDVVVSIGSERTVATGAEDAEPVRRRYTHVWVYRNLAWQLVARQSVVVQQEG